MHVTKSKEMWTLLGICCMVLTLGVFLVILGGNDSYAGSKKKADQVAAYKLYKAKCLGCHDSVADPEKPGRTRDTWFVVVNVMHDYGLDLSDKESAMIVDLLYALRKGMERDPG